MIERVHFRAPPLRHLKENGFLCIDMHFHSKYSDTFTRPKNIVKYAAKKGVGVAITDHNHISGFFEAYRYNKEFKYNIPMVPGIEISTKQGPHILAYFYNALDAVDFYERHIKSAKAKNPYMALKLTAEEIVEKASGYNCILSVAHPRSVSVWDFQKKINEGAIDKRIVGSIECAEVICGLVLRKMNIKAIKWALEERKGITGGSDGHTLHKLGSVVTYSETDDIVSFLDAIRKKDNYVIGSETRLLPRVLSYSKALTKHSRYAGPSIMIHRKLVLKDGLNKIKEKITNGKNRIFRR